MDTRTSLVAALGGLLELDLRSKGISLTGATVHMDDAMDALGLQLWIAEHAIRVTPGAVSAYSKSEPPGAWATRSRTSRSDSMANTQRPSGMSSRSMRSGSRYSW